MPQVSRHPLTKPVHDRVIDIFLETFTRLSNKHKAQVLLNDLLTPTEKIMLAKRLAIAYLLDKGYDYRSISRSLKVSFGTITRINHIKLTSGEGFTQVISSMVKEKQIQDYFSGLEEKIAHLLPPKSRNWSDHYRLNKRGREAPPF